MGGGCTGRSSEGRGAGWAHSQAQHSPICLKLLHPPTELLPRCRCRALLPLTSCFDPLDHCRPFGRLDCLTGLAHRDGLPNLSGKAKPVG